MGRHYSSWPALIVPSPALIVPLPVNRLSNKLTSKMPHNIPRNPPFAILLHF